MGPIVQRGDIRFGVTHNISHHLSFSPPRKHDVEMLNLRDAVGCRKCKVDVAKPEASPYRRLSVLITGDHQSNDR